MAKYCLFLVYFYSCSILISCGLGQPQFLAPPPNSSPTVELASAAGRDGMESVTGSYLVLFRAQASESAMFFSSFFAEYQYHYLNLASEFIADPRIKSLDILDSSNISLKSQDSSWKADFDAPAAMQLYWQDQPNDALLGVLTKVNFQSESEAAEVLKEWEIQGRIWYAEPNGISRPNTASIWDGYKSDYQKSNNTWHKNIGLIDAYNSLATNEARRPDADVSVNGPVIAVLDSGTDYEHPQLKGRIWVNEAGKEGVSGCDGDKYGCNTTAPSKGTLGNGEIWPVGTSGPGVVANGQGKHGTHVAGIIAAIADSTGVKKAGGVCPVCRIMTVKVAEIDGSSDSATPGITDDSQIRGLKYVTRFKTNESNAVRIVNSSFGKYSRSRSVAILVDALKKIGSGTLVIAAASNEDSMIRSYPAALSNAVAVSALDDDNKKSSFSNFGPWVDISAPGKTIVSTVPGGGEGEDSGTSMAAPVVAGAAGMLLAMEPNLSFDELRNRIIDCADSAIYTADTPAAKFNSAHYFPLISGEDSKRPLLGSGIVNVNNMLTKSCKSSVGRPLDRVTPGCSTIQIAGTSADQRNVLVVILFLIAPLICWQFDKLFQKLQFFQRSR